MQVLLEMILRVLGVVMLLWGSASCAAHMHLAKQGKHKTVTISGFFFEFYSLLFLSIAVLYMTPSALGIYGWMAALGILLTAISPVFSGKVVQKTTTSP